MKRVLLTGMSGTGKSSVLAELLARGFKTVETDHGEWTEQVKVPADADVLFRFLRRAKSDEVLSAVRSRRASHRAGPGDDRTTRGQDEQPVWQGPRRAGRSPRLQADRRARASESRGSRDRHEHPARRGRREDPRSCAPIDDLTKAAKAATGDLRAATPCVGEDLFQARSVDL